MNRHYGSRRGFLGRVSRRSLFRSSLVIGAAAAIPSSLDRVSAHSIQAYADAARNHADDRTLAAYHPAEHSAFMHGVASGDPLPTSVILWTRVTPDPAAVPGSGVGPAVTLGWEVACDEEMVEVVRSGRVRATADTDHTVHIDPHGLEPGTIYFFRFTALDGPVAGAVSVVGRTGTAPAEEARPEELRLAVCSCANFESGYFSAYGAIAEAARAGEIDVVVHMGDYLYEYASGAYPGKHGVVRPHVPAWGLLELRDYRARYGHYRRDTQLQAAHGAAPWVVTWDDHEIANNAYAHGAENHRMFDGDWEVRRDAAMRAYLEWLPVRGTSPSRGGRIYRTLRFGRLAELHMLDLRSYRSAPGSVVPGLRTDPGRTIMGSEQFSWLSARLATAETRWNLIGTSVMMAPFNLIGVDKMVQGPVAELVGATGAAAAEGSAAAGVNSDQWDGYASDRRRLLSQLAEGHGHGRTVFLTGDIHSEWATYVVHEGAVVAAELVATSVSAANVDDMLRLGEDNPLSTAAERHIRLHNPHVAHVDLDAHGYARLRVTAAGAQMRWYRVAEVTEPGSPVTAGPELTYDGRYLSR